MRIAVMTDIHANHYALEAVLDYIYSRSFDRMVFLGDYVTDCPYPQKTLSLLRNIPKNYEPVFIRGNREDYMISYRQNPVGWDYNSKTGALLYTYENLTADDIDGFAALPISARLRYDGCTELLACHGSPEKTNYLFQTETPEAEALLNRIDCDTLICGHSHAPYIFRRGARQIINAGALGLPKNNQTAAQFMELTPKQGEWCARLVSVSYDIEAAVAEFSSSGLLEKSRTWGRAIIGTLRKGINYTVYTLREVERLSAESGLDIADERLWVKAAQTVGVPQV